MKFNAYVIFAVLLYLPGMHALGQSLTVKDSAGFQKQLTASQSDFHRINYQLKLAEYAIRKRGSFKADLDNARMWIDRAKKLNMQLRSREAEGHILFEEFYLLQENGPSPKGKAMIQAVIPLLQDGSDQCLLAVAYKELSYYYSLENRAELNLKIGLIEKSVTLFKQCGNKFKTANTLQYLADLYVNANNYQKALSILKESLATYNAINFKQIQGVYDLFGQINYTMADYNNCLRYELLALKTSEQLKDSTMQACEIENHLGLTLIQLDQINKAINYFKDAKMLALKNKDLNSVVEVSFNLVDCYNELREPKEGLKMLREITRISKNSTQGDYFSAKLDCLYVATLIQLKQFDLARNYVAEMLPLIRSPNISTNSLANIYSELVYYYFTTKNYSSELTYLVKYQKIAEQIGEPAVEMNNLASWYQLDSARKDYKQAFYHILKYKALADSIFNEKKSQQLGQLQIRYETEKKEDELRLKNQDIRLLIQNASIARAQLKEAQLYRNITMGGVIVVVLIALMQYRRYHEKQKNNLVITHKNTALQQLVNEKEWLLKEVHHRVKNNLHTVICLLESQAAYLENDALKAVENSRHRIYAMSLIHQKLYQSDDIKVVDMNLYLSEFVQYLRESFGSPENIQVILQADDIKLAAAQAVPVGLIINEAVNNAFKYAFPKQRCGEIRIQLISVTEEIYLSVTDNGVGFKLPVGQELKSLGLELIRGLAADLRGSINIGVDNGTSIGVRFLVDKVDVPAVGVYKLTAD